MGLFDNYKNATKVSTRNDDRDGTYWQRINKVEIATSRKKKDYVKVSKTTFYVVDDREGKAQPVGADTTDAFWPDEDPDFSYFERDTKRFVQACLGLTTEEANELTGEKIEKMIKDGTLDGSFVEVDVRTQVNKKSGKEFTNVNYRKEVTDEMVEETVDDGVIKSLGLLG